MEPKVLKDEQEYEAALVIIDELLNSAPGTPQAERLELWSHLVEAYEDDHHPIPPPDPIEAIRFRMEQESLRQVDLVPYLGSKSRVSEILNRKRSLSLPMIRSLHAGLGIPAEVLIGEPAAGGL